MNRTMIILVAATLFVVGIVYLYYRNTTNVSTETVEIGYRGYAAINRLLAAQRFLESFGEKVEARRNLRAMRSLPAPGDTLFLLRHSDKLTLNKVNAVLRWVDNGGRLVIGPESDRKKRKQAVHSLLSRFGITQVEAPKAGMKKIAYFGQSQPLAIKFDSKIRFRYRGYKQIDKTGDRHGILLLRLRYGRGSVIAISDPSVFYNKRIAEADHAALLNALTLPRRSSTYWFLYSNSFPGFFELVYDQLWPALIALAMLILSWITASLQRFGPILPSETASRRSLLEHIAASGRLLWRHRQEQHLIAATRARLHQRIEAVYPSWAGSSNETLIDNLSATTGIARSKISLALEAGCRHSEQDFTQLIHLLERLRKAL